MVRSRLVGFMVTIVVMAGPAWGQQQPKAGRALMPADTTRKNVVLGEVVLGEVVLGEVVLGEVVLGEVVLGEVVVSASKVEESILQSPVTVEKLSARQLRLTPASSFFDAIEHVKGVQVITPSLSFKVINARGFTNTTFRGAHWLQRKGRHRLRPANHPLRCRPALQADEQR